MAEAQLEVSVERCGDAVVVVICGHLDALRANRAVDQLSGVLAAKPPRVVVDMSGVEWVDSAGVGVLISIYRRVRASKGDLKVVGLRHQPAEVFRLLRLEHAFDVLDTIECAMVSWGQRAE